MYLDEYTVIVSLSQLEKKEERKNQFKILHEKEQIVNCSANASIKRDRFYSIL